MSGPSAGRGPTLPIAVLVSGAGTILEALAERAADGRLPIRIVAVVADRSPIPALARARARGLPTVVVPRPDADGAAWSYDLSATLVAAGAEALVHAGFLSVLPGAFVDRWYGRAINVHPSLLPRHGGRGMYGDRIHRAVLDAGEAETGATVHLVARAIDAGPVLAQGRIAVRPDDTPATLRERLRPLEVALLADVLARFASGALPLPYRPVPSPADEAAATRG